MGDRIEQPAGTFEHIIVIFGVIVIIMTLIWGISGYDNRQQAKREASYNSDVKEWCLKEGGKPVYIGRDGTWNCEL